MNQSWIFTIMLKTYQFIMVVNIMYRLYLILGSLIFRHFSPLVCWIHPIFPDPRSRWVEQLPQVRLLCPLRHPSESSMPKEKVFSCSKTWNRWKRLARNFLKPRSWNWNDLSFFIQTILSVFWRCGKLGAAVFSTDTIEVNFCRIFTSMDNIIFQVPIQCSRICSNLCRRWSCWMI